MCLSRNQLLFILFTFAVIIIVLISTSKKSKQGNEYYSRRRRVGCSTCGGKKVEKYRYINVLSATEKATKLADRIQQAYNLYVAIQKKLPQIKKMYATITDWEALKPKLCLWAKDKKLVSGLIALITKRIEKGNLSAKSENRLRKLKVLFLKLQALQASLSVVGDILSLVPSAPNEVKVMVNVLSNLDNSILQLFSAAGVQICL